MKSLRFPLVILFTILVSAWQTQSQNVSKNALQTFFSYDENNEILISAHRCGKGYAGYPENCLETMQYIKSNIPNALFEIDVAKTKDGVLILMHDDALERTSNGFGRIDQNSWEALSKLSLKDDFGSVVDFKIPLFTDVLDWAKRENAILTVDIKRGIELEEVITIIEERNALMQCVIITYSIEDAQKLYRLNPDVVLSVTIRNMKEFDRAYNSGIPWENMLAFTGTMESDPALYKKLHQNGVMCMLGTLGNLDKKAAAKGDSLYLEWAKLGIDVFATDRALEVQKIFSGYHK